MPTCRTAKTVPPFSQAAPSFMPMYMTEEISSWSAASLMFFQKPIHQVIRSWCIWILKILKITSCVKIHTGAISVSYTHLDVYKRQVLPRLLSRSLEDRFLPWSIPQLPEALFPVFLSDIYSCRRSLPIHWITIHHLSYNLSLINISEIYNYAW